MRDQQIILAGIIVWLTGCYLDFKLVQYSYTLIILGTLISAFGTASWLRSKENRIRLKETMKPKKEFVEMIKQLFDFRWQRVSIIWTISALVGMLIVHLGSVGMKSMGAYECAVQAIKKDKEIIEEIGDVKDFTYMISGRATTASGFSEFYFGVLGTKKSVYVTAIIENHSGSYIPHKIIIQD